MRKGKGTDRITITEEVYIEGADVTLEPGDVIKIAEGEQWENLDKDFLINLDYGTIITPRYLQDYLDAGADINAQNRNGKTPLMVIIAWGPDSKLVQAYIDAGADIEARDKFDNTPLLIACNRKETEAIQVLIDNGAKVDIENYVGITPLLEAARNNMDLVFFKTFIKGGCDINAEDSSRDGYGRTPLLYAIERGNEDAVEFLIRSGADITITDSEGETPLMSAINAEGDAYEWPIVELLFNANIKQKIDVDWEEVWELAKTVDVDADIYRKIEDLGVRASRR